MTKTCFIISPIGKEGSPIRKDSDDKFDLIFEPILADEGYAATRADKIASLGSISREIVQNLLESDLVIADASGGNANVFYELAIRNAIGKPVILVKLPHESLLFDVYDKRAINIDRADPRSWEDAKQNLRAQIQMAQNSPEEASKSILSDFGLQIGEGGQRTDLDKIFTILKDIKEEIRRTSSTGKWSEQVFQNQETTNELFTKFYEYLKGSHHVSIPAGTGALGCDEDNSCFVPSHIEIKVGETVQWTNDDTAAHTVTSGDPKDGPTGKFDSSLFVGGNSFSHTFSEKGEFSYFCMVHPWQQETIIVK